MNDAAAYNVIDASGRMWPAEGAELARTWNRCGAGNRRWRKYEAARGRVIFSTPFFDGGTMNVKLWAIIGAGLCFLPVCIVIGAVMALCGNDPFRELRRITRDAR